jgi:hypothetical protein
MKSFILAMLLAVMTVSPGWAAEKKAKTPPDDPMVPKIDKTFWRRMAQTDAESTSPCIGSRESPICVVETHLACHTRRIYDLCRYAMGEIDELPEKLENHNPSQKWNSRDYMVWYAKRVTKRELPWPSGLFDNELPDVQWQDVTMVILFRYCFKGGCYSYKFNDPHPHQYVMRKTERGWIMTYWFDRGPIKNSMPFYYATPKKK